VTSHSRGLFPQGILLRTATAFAYAVTVLAALWFGPITTAIVFGIMAAVAAAELYAFTRREARLPNEVMGVAGVAAMPLAAAIWGITGMAWVITALVIASLVAHTQFIRLRASDTAMTLMGAIYIGFFIGHFVLIRSIGTQRSDIFTDGLVLAAAVLLSVWVADVFAYLIGSKFGRHKMAPRISPKKSWEGFAAGTAGVIAFWQLVPAIAGPVISSAQALLLGVAIAIAAVVGDLFESRLKREAGVKDSGNSLPGHGGFLDRLDSIIFVSLVAYWMLQWMGIR
jgi:phosphatidate cytidylyltransferase